MAPQRYEPVASDEPSPDQPIHPSVAAVPITEQTPFSSSPPPSFRSRSSSQSSQSPAGKEAEPRTQTEGEEVAPNNEPESDSDGEDEEHQDSRRLLAEPSSSTIGQVPIVTAPSPPSSATEPPPVAGPSRPPTFPAAITALTSAAGIGGLLNWTRARTNDGVFANVQASGDASKPEEHLPTYEQAAADAAPQYWESTILAPGVSSDTVFVDGLPVGTFFSFVWNGLISVSFQFIGFLLTYLLHTTHAAKNGSRAGLGITFIQYGFYMKASASRAQRAAAQAASNMKLMTADLTDPNIDPAKVQAANAIAAAMEQNKDQQHAIMRISGTEWLAYLLMIVGWFVLIKSISNYVRARRAEQLILNSPERGLAQPVVATGEGENAV